MASTFGRISRRANVAADSAIQRCSSSRCSKVKILSALSLTGVVRNAVPASVGLIVVDMFGFFSFRRPYRATLLRDVGGQPCRTCLLGELAVRPRGSPRHFFDWLFEF